MKIREITRIDKRHIAILDTSALSFMQVLQNKGINAQSILNNYELILIPQWVLNEISDSKIRMNYIEELIETGFPIYSITEEAYSELTGYEEGNLYQIVLASTFMLGRIRAYLRRFVEKSDVLDMDSYSEWINKLYANWPIHGEILTNGRQKKKNAGEISITILTEILSWYYSETETLTVYSQDSDLYEFQRKAEEVLTQIFLSKTPVPVSFKSNDAILCQLFREGVIGEGDIARARTDEKKITYSREHVDYSVSLITETVDNELFVELIKDSSVHIVF